ncbi:tRNA lysidine(34) synthetase TilS [Maribacter sp. 2308TA10-17]|uniref:tRNA lysidine(34) synthetase TilS n=1 Tax=Maribacter sp. 2308TA10-17 TaxID=3386276 RepID=UPI0039BC8197
MLNEFKKHLETNFPNLISEHFLLACSGGLDSVVLTHLFHNLKLDLSIAHCNFQLRGAESDSDEEFVTQLAKRLNIKLNVNHFETTDYVAKNKVNVQIAARELRYAWFAELMEKNQIRTLITAHHADDNLETFLINLSRGTGIDGLTGIPAKTETISRPLLAFSRAQILDYARAENLEWREDSSNADVKYLRNKIRHELIPVLRELHPTFLQNFELTQSHLKGAIAVLNNHVELLKSRIFESHNDGFRISIEELAVLHPQNAYLHALLKDYGFTAWKDVERLLNGLSGKEVRSKTHRLVKDRDYLLLETLKAAVSESYTIEEEQSEIRIPIKIEMEAVAELKETSENILYVDKDSLNYPLVVRKWEKGDYFYPFGMSGRKKLSKYFKDEKVDVISKEKQWLLCSGDDIVWVIGRRSDQRFSVNEKTKQIVKFTIPQ